MAQEELTRRDAMRKGGQLAAAGVVAGSAGCLNSIPFIGGAAYKNWMHEPGEMNDGTEYYGFRLAKPKAILNKEDKLEDNFVERYEEGGTIEDLTGVEPDSVNWRLNYSSMVVVNADMNKGDVIDELEGNDFEEDSTYNGYQLFVNEEEGSEYRGLGFAVKGGKFAATSGSDADDVIDRLEMAVDTRKGNENRYVEESDAMKVLINKLGSKHIVRGDTFDEDSGRWEGQVGDGSMTQVKGDKTQLKQVFVFEDNSAAQDADVDDWVDEREDGDGIWSEADNINVNVNGKAAVAKAKVDSDELGQ